MDLYLFSNITELHDGYTDQTIVACETVVFDADVQLEGFERLLVTNSATMKSNAVDINNHQSILSAHQKKIF